MIVQQKRHSNYSIQQSLAGNSETTNNQYQFNSYRMQQIYTNENLLSQRDNEHYNQSNHYHQHNFHPHFQYQYENQSVSPQQSSTSDVDEISPTSSSSINRGSTTITHKIIKKKKVTKKKRKDPNEPQKPVSPYALFFRDTQNEIKKNLSNPSFGEISKVVAHMWENIDPELKEEYKRKAASAKKEYLKQLAAYRAVQISHQAPNMHHLLNQTSLPFNTHPIQHQQKQYHTGSMIPTNHHHHHHHQQQQQFCPSSSIQQYNNYHYINPYSQDNSNLYHTDRQIYISNHSQPIYTSYDSNNNYSDYQQYGLLRPIMESEQYSSYYDTEHIKSNENLLNNKIPHYIDLSSMTTNGNNIHHHGLNDKKEDEHLSVLPNRNENNNFHWNQTTSSTTQW